MMEICQTFPLVQGFDAGTDGDALTELPHLREVQVGIELWLAYQNDLEEFLPAGFQIGEHP
jgi:hypothetical protein